MSLATPVAIFAFNRPAQVRQLLAALAPVRPGLLLVVCDGPRPAHAGDAPLCAEVRALLQDVPWRCEIRKDFAEANLGCRRRVASGLDWVFAQVPEAIILEDDCVPDPTFFPFCEELLVRYRDDARVHAISGCNLLGGRRFGEDSYYFSRFFHVWGWASWARAWQHYDLEMRRWPELRDSGWLERYLPTRAMARLARYYFEGTYAGDQFTTWDYQWVFASWLRNAHSIVPATNLVTNIGFDASGSHSSVTNPRLARMSTEPMQFPLRHPAQVAVLEEADRLEWARLHPRAAAGWWRQVARGLRGRLARWRRP